MIIYRLHSMHPQSYPLTIGRTVLKEFNDLVILGVTFDSKIRINNNLRSVCRAASQRLGTLMKCCRVFYDRFLLVRCFQVFFLPILEYCSSVWCSAEDTHLKQLDHVVNVTLLFRSVAALCMLYKFKCNSMHSLNGALPGSYVPVRVTGAHQYTYAPPRSTIGVLFPSQCLSGTILLTLYLMVWDWQVSRAGHCYFYWPKLLYPYYCLLLFYPSLHTVYRLVLWGCGLRTDRE